jgi:hypothetical protein
MPQLEALKCLETYFDNHPDEHRIALVVMPTGLGESGVVALARYVLNSNSVFARTLSLFVPRTVTWARTSAIPTATGPSTACRTATSATSMTTTTMWTTR